ncbi:hypothetical protein [Morganella morganii]|uniref:hypothetical protein n=1 Tax=Morganella morganii TaxID=582 RepID=UPI000A7B8D15|nr:hypothetical protein [Morganella morganii]
MATIKLADVVSTTTASGDKADISGINPTSTDFLVGVVFSGGRGYPAMWDQYGTIRDNSNSWNIDISSSDELTDLRDTGLSLLSESIKKFL